MSHTAPDEAVIYGYLKSIGFTDAGAAAALGNFQVETGGTFSPTTYNPGEKAIGIAQWEGSRRTALQHYAAAHGGKETDLAMQLGYLGTELAGGYKSIFAAMRRASNPSDAAAIWDVGPGGANSGTGFENSSGDATASRQSDAGNIYEQIQTGTLTAKKALTGHGTGVDDSGILGGILGGIDSGGSSIGGAVNAANPFNWFSGLMKQVATLVIKGLFVSLGLGTILLGLYATARKATQ